MNSSKTIVWIEGAIVAAIAMALSLIPIGTASGFSISIGMIPITVYSFRRGVQAGMYCGLVWGVLHIILSVAVILTLYQGFIEYIVAFIAAGFSGVYAKKVQQSIVKRSKRMWVYIFLGSFLGTFLRYLFHFYAGVIFWGEYAQWGLGPVMYSFVINGVNALLTAIVTFVVVLILAKKAPKLILTKQKTVDA